MAKRPFLSFLLSTFNDGRQAVALIVNPLGVQADGTLIEGLSQSRQHGFSGLAKSREAPGLAPDFVFQSKGQLTEHGYEIEVRVPFKSLRYQKADIQNWGLHVLRKSPFLNGRHSRPFCRKGGPSWFECYVAGIPRGQAPSLPGWRTSALY